MEKMNRILEVFWLILTILVSALVIYMIATEGFYKGYNQWLVIFPLLTAAVYLLRRGLRIKFEKARQEALQKNEKKK
jgi:hypothetical protein